MFPDALAVLDHFFATYIDIRRHDARNDAKIVTFFATSVMFQYCFLPIPERHCRQRASYSTSYGSIVTYTESWSTFYEFLYVQNAQRLQIDTIRYSWIAHQLDCGTSL